MRAKPRTRWSSSTRRGAGLPDPLKRGNSGVTLEPRVRVEQQPAEARREPPKKYRVLLHDDEFTTMDFVVRVLSEIFAHPSDVAVRIMLDVHHQGVGLAGVYPHEVAEAKAAKVIALARQAEFPFLATIEPEEA